MTQSLLHQLPSVRGRYTENADLKKQVWFRAGGPAEILFKPEDIEDLCTFLKEKPGHIPVTILGMGSNILVRDGGIPGVVIKLKRSFSHIQIDGTHLTAGGGALDRTVALTAAEKGLSGLSFLAGIPGTIGGAIKMNAGAYGHEVKDTCVSCQVITKTGELKTYIPKELDFQYRKSGLQEGSIVVSATFSCSPEDPDLLHQEIDQIMKERTLTQPTKSRTGGSTFKNPPNQKAWELIDAAGCRGHRVGDAMVSEKHCNFLINIHRATATDLEDLGAHVQKQVFHSSGIQLEWEIKRLGTKNKDIEDA